MKAIDRVPRKRKPEEYVGAVRVTVTVGSLPSGGDTYEALFLVDAGATDSMAPASELRQAGIASAGKMTYELADGSTRE